MDNSKLQEYILNYNLPMELEIGFGYSSFLLKLAKNNHNKYYIGIDKYSLWYVLAEKRRLFKKINNLIYIHSEGFDFIRKNIPANRILGIHLYFPSPVPIENRIFTQEFVFEIYRILKKNSFIRIITDDQDYFMKIFDLFNNHCWEHVNWIKYNMFPSDKYLVWTPCEMKYGSKFIIHAIKL